TLLKDVAHAYVQQVSVPAQLRHVLDTAFRIAQAQRTVTAIIIPADLQQEDAADPKRKHGNTFSGIGYSAPQVVPRDADLQRAADLLNAGERVAMLIGAGALGATPEVIATAEVLGAGIAKAILGKAVVPDDHPFCTGSIGLLGTRPSFDMMAGCDTLLMVGSTLPYSEFLPPEGKVRGVQIDIDPKALSLRYPMDVNLHGDASLTLRALLPYLRPKGESDWTRTIRRNIGEWWELMDRMAYVEAKPLNPRQVLWEGSPRLPDGAIVAADSGTAAYWYAQNFKLRAGQMGSLSGNLATMGNAVPYAIAAKFCYPDRPALAIVGDGAMQMAGLNELITIAKYWREWADPRLVILVLNNRDLNLVTWEQRVLTGDPKYDAAQNIPNFPYARYAADLGLTGIVVDQPHGVAGAWEAAWSAGRPVVLEAIVDPTVPPLPPHITFDQAVKFFKAVVKGDPQR
ncbi:MAG TPA: thiamine pyrophosphate-dependent enzyme, partial [bacterium]|nr:thiamine pyrophosphate-dependent enzyme [bacterium]